MGVEDYVLKEVKIDIWYICSFFLDYLQKQINVGGRGIKFLSSFQKLNVIIFGRNILSIEC